MGKIGQVAAQGRTVLFVSRNLAAIRNLCERTIWVDQGRIICDGDSRDVAGRYLGSSRETRQTWTRRPADACEGPLAFAAIRVTSGGGDKSALHFDESVAVGTRYRLPREATNHHVLV